MEIVDSLLQHPCNLVAIEGMPIYDLSKSITPFGGEHAEWRYQKRIE